MKYLTALLFVLSISISPSAYSQAPATNADRAYFKAEQIFLRDNLEETLKQLARFFKKFGNSAAPATLAKAHNLRGLTLFQLNSTQSSSSEFQKAVDIAEAHFTQNEPELHIARYNLANALLKSKQANSANNVLLKVNPAILDEDTKIRYYHLLGRALEATKNYPSSVVAYLFTTNELEQRDSTFSNPIARKAYELSKNIFLNSNESDLARIENLEGKMRENGVGTWTARLILARGYMFSGRREEALDLLNSFLDKAKNHPLEAEGRRLIQLMQKLSIVNPHRVGILLPLSGRFQKYGRLSLKSALLARKNLMKARKTSQVAGPNIEFVIRDSGSTEESAKIAFERLATEDHVVGIIGPLLKRQALEVGRLAQEYGVPLFSLSRKQALSQLGSFIFPFALTPEQQVNTLLDHLMTEKGFKRFAILSPSSPAAKEYVNIFWTEVEKRGGLIRGYEEYAAGSTDFRFPLKKLLGLFYEGARLMEKRELKRREKIYASTLKARGKLRERMLSQYKLKPIVDFDAVFVPDGPKAIGQIAPSFAVYGIKNLPFLGLNTWNTMDIVNRAGQYLQRSYFVDSFYSHSRRPEAIKFIREFRANFGSSPATLEVQAYDATRILIHAIASGKVVSRSDLRNHIRTHQDLRGISGTFKFDNNGVQRGTYLLGVSGKKILEVERKRKHL